MFRFLDSKYFRKSFLWYPQHFCKFSCKNMIYIRSMMQYVLTKYQVNYLDSYFLSLHISILSFTSAYFKSFIKQFFFSCSNWFISTFELIYLNVILSCISLMTFIRIVSILNKFLLLSFS